MQWRYKTVEVSLMAGPLGRQWITTAETETAAEEFLENALEKLGHDGWELVTTLGEGSSAPILIFKCLASRL
ncbi:MAG TPA: DUF4177 domain-containing protein [Ktedonobacterales bacterium]|jgi:hypothetical protein